MSSWNGDEVPRGCRYRLPSVLFFVADAVFGAGTRCGDIGVILGALVRAM